MPGAKGATPRLLFAVRALRVPADAEADWGVLVVEKALVEDPGRDIALSDRAFGPAGEDVAGAVADVPRR